MSNNHYNPESHRKMYDSRKAEHKCVDCGNPLDSCEFTSCEFCRDKEKIYRKGKRLRNKQDVVQHYGGRCACCGEVRISMLTIDHINNDGARQRTELFGKRTGGGSMGFYNWIRRNGYPPSLQVLCGSCQLSKAILGVCEHKMERGND